MLAGAGLFAVFGFLLGSLATNWYSDHWAKSDDDINRSVAVFLVVWPLFIGLGAWIGHAIHRRSKPS